jgi:hypothetical protein
MKWMFYILPFTGTFYMLMGKESSNQYVLIMGATINIYERLCIPKIFLTCTLHQQFFFKAHLFSKAFNA